MDRAFRRFAIRRVSNVSLCLFLGVIMLGNCLACVTAGNIARNSPCCSHSHKGHCGNTNSPSTSDEGLPAGNAQPACGTQAIQPYSEARPLVVLSVSDWAPLASAGWSGGHLKTSAARPDRLAIIQPFYLSDPFPDAVLRI
jgi:hypothetical protein